MNGKALVVTFDDQLLRFIKSAQNYEAKRMLNKNLVKKHDEFGTLLHYAARYGNDDITRRLIDLGSEVDATDKDGKTPLMLAVDVSYHTVRVLLEAGASIDILDDSGKSAMQIAFDRVALQAVAFQLFFRKVRPRVPSDEEALERLITAGCTLHHAVHSKDVKVLEYMLKRGFDIESRTVFQETILNIAVDVGYREVAKWLIDKGADVNALAGSGAGPLFLAVDNGMYYLVRDLLERGADPNAEFFATGSTPLHAAVKYPRNDCNECVELLMEYGAVPRIVRRDVYTIFDHAIRNLNIRIIKILIGYVALLERFGTCDAKSVLDCNVREHRIVLEQVMKGYELCQKMLDTVVFEVVTLFHLLTCCDFKLRTYARNGAITPMIEKACVELESNEVYSHYYSKLIKRVAKVKRAVELEDKAIPIVCKMFGGSQNFNYYCAMEIISYLNEADLERLVLISI